MGNIFTIDIRNQFHGAVVNNDCVNVKNYECLQPLQIFFFTEFTNQSFKELKLCKLSTILFTS